MLGHPVAGIAKAVGKLGEIKRVAQRICARGAGDHRREVENGERDHWGGTVREQQVGDSGKVSRGHQKTTARPVP